MILLGLGYALASGGSVASDDPELPQWYDNYHLSLTVSLPYIDLHVPVVVSTNSNEEGGPIQRVDYFRGLEIDIANESLGAAKIAYVNGKRKCLRNMEPHASRTRGEDVLDTFTSFLPDLSQYRYAGKHLHGGLDTDKYVLNLPHGDSSRMFDQISFLYDPLEKKPISWVMHARNQIISSHSDVYIVTYHDYSPYLPTHIDIPSECHDEETIVRGDFSPRMTFGEMHGHSTQNELGAFLPIETHMDYNMKRIAELNEKHKGKASFTANKFVGMSYEDIIRARTGLRRSQNGPPHSSISFNLTASNDEPPQSFDWRGVPVQVLGKIKDQGFCGSCWAFSFINAVEAAHALLTGELVELPEQFILDCGWTAQSAACDGGLQNDAAAMVQHRFDGGIPTAAEYGSYLTIDGMCKFDRLTGHGARVIGWTVVTPRDDAATIRALLQQPLAISISVPEEMVWFEKGVLDTDACLTKGPEDLVHAVNLIGYGTEKGTDFWLVRNSWSEHWGDNGHIKVARGARDCGITLQPEYPTVGPVHIRAKQVVYE